MVIQYFNENQEFVFENHGLLILLSGSLTLNSGGEEGIRVRKNEFVVVDNLPEITSASPYLKGYVIGFGEQEDEKLVGLMDQLKESQASGKVFHFSREETITDLLQSAEKLKDDLALESSYMHILLSELLRQIQLVQHTNTTIFEKFTRLIDDNIGQNYCAGEYAELLSVPITSLIDEVKEEVGKTPCKVITEHVIANAQDRLLQTGDSSKMIAYQLGFDDPYYFIKYFKKNVGVTPTQFRKQHLVLEE